MKGLFSRLFGPKRSASAENEIAAAIAVALQLYGMGSAPKRAAGTVSRRSRPVSAWNCKSYGLTQLPQRNRRWSAENRIQSIETLNE